VIDLGHFSQVSAFILSVYSLVFGFIAAKNSNYKLVVSARNSLIVSSIFCWIALICLALAFANNDYRYLYVWQHSDNSMPWYYLVSAVWGGMDGSMLLWAAIMSAFVAVSILNKKNFSKKIYQWLTPSLSLAQVFFLLVVNFFTNPFRLVPLNSVISDGNGLNPLLQNPSMMIHPPLLYCGFTGFVIPFGFAIAALLSKENLWLKYVHKWTLSAWMFLTAGIILGGNWAYIELGWGGFWAWDPVENASFLPWLTATAFLHSAMAQEQRGVFKVWNVSLAIATYMLTVFGTFLTRSGIVQSVHAFAEADIGWVFVSYLVLLIIFSATLVIFRLKELKPENQIENFFSREVLFLFNNLIFLSIAFTVMWGVMFPVISEAVAGEKAVVGPPFFNQVTGPMFFSLLALMLFGPFVAWKGDNLKKVSKALLPSLIFGLIISLVLIYLKPTYILAAFSIGLGVAIIFSLEKIVRTAAVKRRKEGNLASAYKNVIRSKSRRFGGHVVHFGVAIMAIAITASYVYKTEKDITLEIGQKAKVGSYEFKLDDVLESPQSSYHAIIAKVSVYKGDKKISTLQPERRAYAREVTTEVALEMNLLNDLYVAFAGIDLAGRDPSDLKKLPLIFKIYINPLQVWLWFGSILVIIGTLIVLLKTQKIEDNMNSEVVS